MKFALVDLSVMLLKGFMAGCSGYGKGRGALAISIMTAGWDRPYQFLPEPWLVKGISFTSTLLFLLLIYH